MTYHIFTFHIPLLELQLHRDFWCYKISYYRYKHYTRCKYKTTFNKWSLQKNFGFDNFQRFDEKLTIIYRVSGIIRKIIIITDIVYSDLMKTFVCLLLKQWVYDFGNPWLTGHKMACFYDDSKIRIQFGSERVERLHPHINTNDR